MSQFIDQAKSKVETNEKRKITWDQMQNPIGVIDMIHVAFNPNMETTKTTRAYIQKATQFKEVNQIGLLTEHPNKKCQVVSPKGMIIFLNEDLARVHYPHYDALIITPRVANFYVR